MTRTKNRIMLAALRLFAKDGYEAVSVRAIAGHIGVSATDLYRHFTNKREIFDGILRRLEADDRLQARAFGLPECAFADAPEAYRTVTPAALASFALAMFRYWTEDRFASSFRKMLTLEQYRSQEASELYQQYFGNGVIGYLTDIFRAHKVRQPRAAALRYYAPFFLLMNQDDAVPSDHAWLIALLKNHFMEFTS